MDELGIEADKMLGYIQEISYRSSLLRNCSGLRITKFEEVTSSWAGAGDEEEEVVAAKVKLEGFIVKVDNDDADDGLGLGDELVC